MRKRTRRGRVPTQALGSYGDRPLQSPSTEAWQRANYLAMKPDVPYLGVRLVRDIPSASLLLIH